MHRLDSAPEESLRRRLHSRDEAAGRRLHANDSFRRQDRYPEGICRRSLSRRHLGGELRRSAGLRRASTLCELAGRVLHAVGER